MGSKSSVLGLVSLGLSFVLLVFGAPRNTRAAQLHLQSGAVLLLDRTPAGAATALNDVARVGFRHAVVQFDRPVDDVVRSQSAAAGVQLLEYVGDNAFFVGLPPDGADATALARVGSLIAAERIQTDWKVHPSLLGGERPAHAVVFTDPRAGDVVGAYILFHRDVTLQTGALAIERHSGMVRDRLESVHGMVIELPAAAVGALAAEDDVFWIEPALPRMSTTNAENRVATQADLAQAPPYNLNGTGITVLVYDGGTARATHQDFGGRLFVRDGAGMVNHSTHVAGTVGGSGAASGGLQRGMAPAVVIQSYGFQYDGSGIFLYTNPGDIEADYSDAILDFGADIANNSIGTNTESNGFDCAIQGNYGVTDAVIDGIVGGSLGGGPFRVVWSVGNERQGSRCDVEGFGDYYSIAPPAVAKNHITIGAVNSNDNSMTSFSSWGPTDDGRMKPDVVGPGCQVGGDMGVTSCSAASDFSYTIFCGTSMSAPTATGCCALLLQDFRTQFPGHPDPRNSTLKILLAHAAIDLINVGPDYQTGYGTIRIRDSIDFMRTGKFREDSIAQGDTLEYTASVPAGTPVLKATMAWDDAPAVPNAAIALVNDLDLVLIDPNGVTQFPWILNPVNPSAIATKGANHRDNIEQALVNGPLAGTWRIRVTGFNVPEGPQPFSICATVFDDAATGIAESEVVARDRPLLRTYPNPFADELAIEFDLDAGGTAAISIYDAAGRRVRELVADNLHSGRHMRVWDGRDESGRPVASGVYFVEIRAGSMEARRKVTALRIR